MNACPSRRPTSSHRLPPLAAAARLAAPSLLVLAAALAALPAIAAPGVYKWREADGRIVYSDLPPRPGVPATLLSAPAGKAMTVAGTRTAPDAAPDWVEQAKLARQKAIERAEAEQARLTAQREAEERAKRCDEIRTSLRALDSGMRLSTVTERGEQIVMAVEERTRRAADLRRQLADDCQG